VEAIILRCLEKNPRHRFQSVPELMRALEAQLPPRARGLPSLPPAKPVSPEVSTNAPTVALTPSEEHAVSDLGVSHGPVATPHVDPAPPPRSLPRALWIGVLVVLAGGLLFALFSPRASAPPPASVPASVPAASAPAPAPSTAPPPAVTAAPPATSVPPAPATSAALPQPSATTRRGALPRRPAPAPARPPPPTPIAPDIRLER
jgi:hypothetical protein